MYWIDRKFSEEEIMHTFFCQISGKNVVDIGNKSYYMPINYVTDEKEVIVDERVPIINLKNRNLEFFSHALKEYIDAFFDSDKYWANPIHGCSDNNDKLNHAIATLWLNATPEDYEHPIEFVRRYTAFLKDKTFDEFSYQGKTIHGIESLKNCSIKITREEQEEFQETPDAILLTIQIEKEDGEKVTKKLPRIAYGIADGTAYIYGIQGYHSGQEDPKEMKKVNRSRFKLNDMSHVPDDYHRRYLRQEPYAYLSLFTFLCMLQEKGITKVAMPAYLPLRYEGKEIGLAARMEDFEEQFLEGKISSRARKEGIGKIHDEINKHQKVQYTVTNKFLDYMSRLECDIPGIRIEQIIVDNNLGNVIDISNMKVSPDSSIFFEVSEKIKKVMKTKEPEER